MRSGRARFYETNPPLHYCSQIVEYPRLAFGISVGLYLSAILVSGILIFVGYDLYPIRFSDIKFEVRSDDRTRKWKAFSGRSRIPDLLSRLPHMKQQKYLTFYEVIFQTTDNSNILTKKHLEYIGSIQQKIINSADYGKFCLRMIKTGQCQPPNSLKTLLSGFRDANYERISENIYRLYHSPISIQSSTIRQLLGVSSVITSNRTYSPVTRLQFFLGGNLENSTDMDADKKTATKYLKKHVFKMLRRFESVEPPDIKMYFFGEDFMNHEIERFTLTDMALISGSFICITILLCSQTGSLFLGFCGMFSIVGSFVLANLIYRILTGFQYFGIFHVLSIFIILGIGADNVFIFVDTWRQSGTADFSFPTLAHRLSHVYGQASLATAQTSLTTIVAFGSSAASPLLAISSFGVFSALLVMTSYISVIIFFPTAIIFGHRIILCYRCSCRCCCVDETLRDSLINARFTSESIESYHESVFDDASIDEVSQTLSDMPTKFGCCTRVFRGPYFNFITHKIVRWCIMAFYLIWMIGASIFTSKLVPEDRQIRILQDYTMIEKANDLRIKKFMSPPPDANIYVLLVWGLKSMDVSECRFRSDVICKGPIETNPKFDINSADVQLSIRDACRTILNLKKERVKSLRIRMSSVTKQIEMQCFMLDFESYLQSKLHMSLPLNQSNVEPFMKKHPNIYNMSNGLKNFNNYFEVMLNFWLTDGYTMRNTSYFVMYNQLLGETRTNNTHFIKPYRFTGYWGGKLTYVAVQVLLDLNALMLPFDNGVKIADRWDAFTEELNSTMPDSGSAVFEVARKWKDCAILKSLAFNAVIGVLVGLSTSLLILTLTTGNILIALAATLTITLVTDTVIAVIVIADWKLGPLESINMCLVVGLAVDYVVHLAEAYNRSLHRSRFYRVWAALEEVGNSVTSGAITSLASAFFMIFAKILFLHQFGVFLFTTISMSYFFSVGFFPTMMAICGPQDDSGQISEMYAVFRRYIMKILQSLGIKLKAANEHGDNVDNGNKRITIKEPAADSD